MKISLLQMQIKLGDFLYNQTTIQRLIETAMSASPQIIALPEMWNIGFFPRPLEAYADPDGEQCQSFLSKLAKQYQVHIVGGSIARISNQQFYNTNYTFDHTGTLIATYDKVHLFSPAKEDRLFTAGNHLSVFKLAGIRCAVIICYDIRFSELVRSLALEGIDLLFVVAAWPVERQMHWEILNQARAIENQCFVAAINGSGTFHKFHLCGNSMLINPWGEILTKAGETESIITADLNMDTLKEIRNHINVFNDRHPELYFQPMKNDR